MGITVNTSPQQITASVGETKIDVTVSGGIGPSGAVGGGYVLPTATASVLGGVKIGSGISIDGSGVISASAGYTLPTATNSVLGGVKIGSGVTITDGVISVSTNYAAASHTHATSDITGLDATLQGIDSALDGKAATSHASTHATGGADEIAGLLDNWGVEWNEGTSEAGSYLAGTVVRSVGSLYVLQAANSSAVYPGDVLWPELTRVVVSVAGKSGVVTLDAADVGAAAVSHAHGAITSDGKIGTTAGLVLKTGTAGAVEALAQGTAGQVLKVNSGATGVEWGAAAADVSIDTTAADILSASSGSITADDPGADRLVFWDDSAGKLTHLTVGTGLTITDTTITSAGSTSASDLTSGTLAYARMADPTVTSPSQITANQNDYASFARGINRFTTNAARDITGMVAGSDGEVRVLCNVGTTAANTLTIKDESSSSTAANRFSVPWNGDCVIPAEGSVVVFYDGTSSRWRVV